MLLSVRILNTDSKILAKVLPERLRTVLHEIINPDQIGYMKNRYCDENTTLIADVVEFCKIKNFSCIILLVDSEKAFDKVDWSCLNKTIKK